MSNYHFGDNISQIGNYNTGKMNVGRSESQDSALHQLLVALAALDGRIAEDDRRLIDESVKVLSRPEGSSRDTIRRALVNISGVAKFLGQIGAPVIEAVREIAKSLGS